MQAFECPGDFTFPGIFCLNQIYNIRSPNIQVICERPEKMFKRVDFSCERKVKSGSASKNITAKRSRE
jgi:hypothetical protein